MIKDYTKLVLMDLEATCWEGGKPPEGERSEIIQIGLCKLHVATGHRYDRLSLLVRPEYSKVSEYCTRLTGITPKMAMKEGRPLHEVCARILRLGYKKHPWGSYGDDLSPLVRDCELKKAEFPLARVHLDFGALAQLCFGVDGGSISQAEVLRRYGIELEGREHDGSWDAWNLAAAVTRMLKFSG